MKERFFTFLESSSPVRNDPPLFDILVDHINKSISNISVDQLYDELYDKILEREALRKEIQGVFDKRTWNLRAKGRVKQILRLIPKFFKPHCILDIGCSEGSITSELGRSFDLDYKCIIGLDVRKDRQLQNNEEKNPDDQLFTFVLVKDGDPLPFQDESISLVTVIMALHHIKNPMNTLKEIYRVLEPGGYIVYREHDCGSPYRNGIEKDHKRFSIFLDVVHAMYSCVLSSPREMSGKAFSNTFYSRYYSKQQWEKMVRKVGFSYKYEDKHSKQNDIMASYCVSFRKPKRKNDKQPIKYRYKKFSVRDNNRGRTPYRRIIL